MQAHIEQYGRTRAGEEVHRVVIADGIRAEILTYGGIIARLEVPGRDGLRGGRRDNVVLGLPDLAGYETRSPSFGATVGRYANRIGDARFTLDGITYTLPKTEGDNTLHGGIAGFSKRVWTIAQADATSVTLAYTSADGEEGFPGTLATRVRFAVEGTVLRLGYTATTDRPTVLNLTNHSYFNLAGEGSGDVWGHEVRIAADRIVELDDASIPTGRLLDVGGGPFDFRDPVPVGARVRVADPQLVVTRGYDACFVLNGSGRQLAAEVWERGSGRVMSVWTDQPAVQLYSGNKLDGSLVGPSNRAYRSGDGLCFETQHFPDSPNHPEFPGTTLRPGEVFRTETEYVFRLC